LERARRNAFGPGKAADLDEDRFQALLDERLLKENYAAVRPDAFQV